MAGIPGLYFVIAGENLARFVRPDPDNCPHTIEVVDFMRQSPNDGPTDSPEPESSRGQFINLLAFVLDENFAVDLFSHLVLVGTPAVLDALVASLDPATRVSLYGSLAKNLVSVPDLELWPHFLPWLQPWCVTLPATMPMNDC